MVLPVALGASLSSHYLPFVADKGLEMKNQGDANSQDDSCCHVIPGLELSEKGEIAPEGSSKWEPYPSMHPFSGS